MEGFGFWAVTGTVAVIAVILCIRSLILRRPRESDSFISTGLRAVDLFVPLPRGGDILITGNEGAGSTVLGNEIVQRLLEHPTEDFHVSYFLDEKLADLTVRLAEMDDILPTLTSRYTLETITDDDIRRQSLERKSGHTVIIITSDNQRFLQIARDSIKRVRENSLFPNGLTTVTVTGCLPMSEFDARIECSRMIANQGIYPAIDPGSSHSSVYSDPAVLRRQRQIANAASKAIADLMQTIYEGAAQDSEWAYNQDANKRPALQALCFMSQTFFTAEIYTGKKAAFVPIPEMINDFATILSEKKKNIAASKFMYVNSLPNE